MFKIQLLYTRNWCDYGRSRDSVKLFASMADAEAHVSKTRKLALARDCRMLRIVPA